MAKKPKIAGYLPAPQKPRTYSQLQRVIESLPDSFTIKPQSLRNFFIKQGVKPVEIDRAIFGALQMDEYGVTPSMLAGYATGIDPATGNLIGNTPIPKNALKELADSYGLGSVERRTQVDSNSTTEGIRAYQYGADMDLDPSAPPLIDPAPNQELRKSGAQRTAMYGAYTDKTRPTLELRDPLDNERLPATHGYREMLFYDPVHDTGDRTDVVDAEEADMWIRYHDDPTTLRIHNVQSPVGQSWSKEANKLRQLKKAAEAQSDQWSSYQKRLVGDVSRTSLASWRERAMEDYRGFVDDPTNWASPEDHQRARAKLMSMDAKGDAWDKAQMAEPMLSAKGALALQQSDFTALNERTNPLFKDDNWLDFLSRQIVMLGADANKPISLPSGFVVQAVENMSYSDPDATAAKRMYEKTLVDRIQKALRDANPNDQTQITRQLLDTRVVPRVEDAHIDLQDYACDLTESLKALELMASDSQRSLVAQANPPPLLTSRDRQLWAESVGTANAALQESLQQAIQNINLDYASLRAAVESGVQIPDATSANLIEVLAAAESSGALDPNARLEVDPNDPGIKQFKFSNDVFENTTNAVQQNPAQFWSDWRKRLSQRSPSQASYLNAIADPEVAMSKGAITYRLPYVNVMPESPLKGGTQRPGTLLNVDPQTYANIRKYGIRAATVGAAAAAGLAANEAMASQPNPAQDYTRDQQPTGKLVGDAPTMAGITADESQRFFGKKTEDDARYQSVLKDVLTRRMVPWVKSLPEHPGVENVAAAVEAIQGRPSTGAGKALAEQFLDHMQSLSYGGANAPDATIPQSQYESWQREGGGDFRMLWGEGAIGRVTPGGAEMFENQRDYDLVRAYSQGRHSPGYEGFFPTMAAGIGEMFDLSGDTTKLYNARLKPDRSGIAEEALYWWDQGNPARDAMEGNPARYKGGIQGSRYPGLSPLTSEGFNQTVSNSDNPVGAWFTAGELAARGPFATMFTRPGELVRSLKQANDQFTVNQWAGRPAPILPDADPIAGYTGGVAAEQARQFQQKAASARAPKVLKALGMQPSYLSPAAEMGANFAGDFIADMGTMAGIGGKAVKLAKGAKTVGEAATALPRSLAHYATSGMADEIPSEAAIGAALYQTQQPDGPMPSMVEAEQYNPNVTLDGSPIAADDPQYRKAWQAGQREQNSRLDRVSRAAKLYRR